MDLSMLIAFAIGVIILSVILKIISIPMTKTSILPPCLRDKPFIMNEFLAPNLTPHVSQQ